MVKKTKMFFACFPFLHTALHGMAGGGGVYVRGLPGLFYLDLFDEWRSCRPQDKGSCEILQLFFTGFRSFHFCHPPPLCFFRNALLTCVHLKFSSCRTSRVDVEPGCWGYDLLTCSTSFQVLYPRCRSLNTLLASVVFGYLQSLPEVSSLRVHFGTQVVLPARRRWDLCTEQLHPLWRKPLREQFICQNEWRCGAHRDVKQLKIVGVSCLSGLVDEVASMLILAMQSLPMPLRRSANATGLFVWPGEGVQMRCDQSTST